MHNIIVKLSITLSIMKIANYMGVMGGIEGPVNVLMKFRDL